MTESLAAYLQALEEQLLQTATRSNPEAVAALLTADFREFGSSGRIYTRREIVAALAAEVPREITLSDFACNLLSEAIALVTYRSQSESSQAIRISLWVLRDGRWQMLFHQGTQIPSEPPNTNASYPAEET